jgi:hypothetical protein
MPFPQPFGHVTPHMPQFFGSVFGLTQAPPHMIRCPEQAHIPLSHVSPEEHL